MKTDTCVYQLTVIDQNVSGKFILGVFVDDILCLGTNTSLVQWFQSLLSEKFSITINIKSDVESFLGMHVTRNRSIKCISIWLYLSLNIMSRFQVNNSSISSYPTCPMSSLDLQDSNNIPLTPSQQKIICKSLGQFCFYLLGPVPTYRFLLIILHFIWQMAINIISTSVTKSSNIFGNLVVLLWLSMVPMVLILILWLIHPMHRIVIEKITSVCTYEWPLWVWYFSLRIRSKLSTI